MRSIDDSAVAAAPPVLKAVAPADHRPSAPDEATLAAHLARSRYGRFTLTDAIRPGWQLDVVPQAGYRHDLYVDPSTGARLPALVAAVSSEDLFETFLALLEPLGETCDVVLESSHESGPARVDISRDGIERLVLESVLWDHEELLLNDGCTGIAVMHPELPLEVQLDEHKLLVVYANARLPFEHVLKQRGLARDDRMRFISQAEHVHASTDRFARQFAEMASALGAT